MQLKHAKKTQEQILAAERREAELQRERMDRQQQNVQEKLQQQKQLIMKQHQVRIYNKNRNINNMNNSSSDNIRCVSSGLNQAINLHDNGQGLWVGDEPFMTDRLCIARLVPWLYSLSLRWKSGLSASRVVNFALMYLVKRVKGFDKCSMKWRDVCVWFIEQQRGRFCLITSCHGYTLIGSTHRHILFSSRILSHIHRLAFPPALKIV